MLNMSYFKNFNQLKEVMRCHKSKNQTIHYLLFVIFIYLNGFLLALLDLAPNHNQTTCYLAYDLIFYQFPLFSSFLFFRYPAK